MSRNSNGAKNDCKQCHGRGVVYFRRSPGGLLRRRPCDCRSEESIREVVMKEYIVQDECSVNFDVEAFRKMNREMKSEA